MMKLLVLCVLVCASLSAAVLTPEYVPTPQGYMLKHCVHHVPSGSHLHPQEDGTVEVRDFDSQEFLRLIPACDTNNGEWPMLIRQPPKSKLSSDVDFPSDYDGWVAYTAFNISQDSTFDTFLGDFSVPDKPAKAPQMLYIFTGLQNDDWIPIVDEEPQVFDIIQPVLQYPSNWGYYWSVKSWYVTIHSGAIYSDELPVGPGEYIFGNMTKTGEETWFVGSTRSKNGKTTQVTVTHPRLRLQPWGFTTIECYGCNGCSTFPQKQCQFSKMSLTENGKSVKADWRVNPQPSQHHQCNEKPIVVDSSAINYQFQ